MAESTLFADIPAAEPGPRATGVLPDHEIHALIRAGRIKALHDVAADQVQPASLDLRLGDVAYRVRASFLPGPGVTVRRMLDKLSMHEVRLDEGAVLERGCVYVVPLQEHVALGYRQSALANPKSSTGRLDVFTRVLTDGATAFDRVAPAYKGPLYAEISPRTFSILARTGSRLCQLRLRQGSPPASDTALRELHAEVPLLDAEPDAGDVIENGLIVRIDLEGDGVGPIGYRAKKHTGIVDVDRRGAYAPADFWEPLEAAPDGLILNPDDFYILATREAVTVPPTHAAEMIAYDTQVGEFRVHYAGFFDPGFGYEGAGGKGSRAVLEVRSHDVPFLLEHGQVVGRLIYERLTGTPERLYGEGIGSSYQQQGLKLGKHFRD